MQLRNNIGTKIYYRKWRHFSW